MITRAHMRANLKKKGYQVSFKILMMSKGDNMRITISIKR